MSALMSTITPSRPLKRVSAKSAPAGKPISVAEKTALKLTTSDSVTIANRAGSPARIKSRVEPLGCTDFHPLVLQERLAHIIFAWTPPTISTHDAFTAADLVAVVASS